MPRSKDPAAAQEFTGGNPRRLLPMSRQGPLPGPTVADSHVAVGQFTLTLAG
jgi:hypothetical protein